MQRDPIKLLVDEASADVGVSARRFHHYDARAEAIRRGGVTMDVVEAGLRAAPSEGPLLVHDGVHVDEQLAAMAEPARSALAHRMFLLGIEAGPNSLQRIEREGFASAVERRELAAANASGGYAALYGLRTIAAQMEVETFSGFESASYILLGTPRHADLASLLLAYLTCYAAAVR